MPGSPVALAARGGDVWAVDPAAGTVVRLERGHRTVRSESAHGVPSDVALAGDHAVVVNGADGTAALFDARSGASRGVVQLGGVGYTDASVATDGRWAWVASGRQLLRIDLVTQVVAATTMLAAATDDEVHGQAYATGVAVGGGSLWVTGDALDPTLWRLDRRRSRSPSAIALPAGPAAVAAGAGAVWVAGQLADAVMRVDRASGRVTRTIAVGREPVAIAVAGDAVWVANRLDGTLSRIDPRTNRVIATIAAGATVEDVAAAPGEVWTVGVS